MIINDVCKYGIKSSIKAGEANDGEYMFFTSSSDESKRYSEYQYDCEGIIMGTGGNATLHYYNGKFSISTDCVVLLTNNNIRCKFLYYILKSKMDVLEAGFKGASLKHTNKSYIGNIDIGNVPSIKEQDEIIKVFDNINNISNNLNKKISQLNELVKARFVEMFGDPFINEKGWKTGKLSELCKINYYKGEIEKNDGKVWLLNLDMIESNTGKLLDYVYEDENNIPSSTMKFEKNCVLYSKLRPYLNKVIIPNKSGYATTELISMKTNIVNNQFLKTLLMQQSFVDFANGTSYGAKMPRASVDSIKSFDLINPPKELQEQFAQFVKQIDKSKFINQKLYLLYQKLLLLLSSSIFIE